MPGGALLGHTVLMLPVRKCRGGWRNSGAAGSKAPLQAEKGLFAGAGVGGFDPQEQVDGGASVEVGVPKLVELVRSEEDPAREGSKILASLEHQGAAKTLQ